MMVSSHSSPLTLTTPTLDSSYEDVQCLAAESIGTQGETTSRNVLKVFLGWHLREFDDMHEPMLTCSQGHRGTPLARRDQEASRRALPLPLEKHFVRHR